MIVIGLCTALTACAPRARVKEPSPDGPTISGLEFAPKRTREGCAAVLRFHFESRAPDQPASGVTAWTLIGGRAGRPESASSMRPAQSGTLGGSTSGEAAIPITFSFPGTYRYSVQVEDKAGRVSNALDAAIEVDLRMLRVRRGCPPA